jgi:hypothetical protein
MARFVTMRHGRQQRGLDWLRHVAEDVDLLATQHHLKELHAIPRCIWAITWFPAFATPQAMEKTHMSLRFFVRQSKPSGKRRLACGSRHGSDQLEARGEWSPQYWGH